MLLLYPELFMYRCISKTYKVQKKSWAEYNQLGRVLLLIGQLPGDSDTGWTESQIYFDYIRPLSYELYERTHIYDSRSNAGYYFMQYNMIAWSLKLPNFFTRKQRAITNMILESWDYRKKYEMYRDPLLEAIQEDCEDTFIIQPDDASERLKKQFNESVALDYEWKNTKDIPEWKRKFWKLLKWAEERLLNIYIVLLGLVKKKQH